MSETDVDSTDPTVPRCCGVGVRVSAHLRRGAAPYADGSLSSQTPSHLISLLIFAVLGLSSRLTWHDFSYVTMAQKVQASTLVYCLYSYPPFLERFCSIMLSVTQLESPPQADVTAEKASTSKSDHLREGKHFSRRQAPLEPFREISERFYEIRKAV